MPKILFNHSLAAAEAGESAKPGDWDPVFTHDEEGRAPNLDPTKPSKTDGIVLKTKPARRGGKTPVGIHRDFNTVTNYSGDPLEVAVGMGETSESDHEYRYAPGLSPLAAGSTTLLRRWRVSRARSSSSRRRIGWRPRWRTWLTPSARIDAQPSAAS